MINQNEIVLKVDYNRLNIVSHDVITFNVEDKTINLRNLNDSLILSISLKSLIEQGNLTIEDFQKIFLEIL